MTSKGWHASANFDTELFKFGFEFSLDSKVVIEEIIHNFYTFILTIFLIGSRSIDVCY